MPQSVVSRYENPDYGKQSLQPLFETADKNDCVFFGRFVDFPTFLQWSQDMSDEATLPATYDPKAIEALLFDQLNQTESVQENVFEMKPANDDPFSDETRTQREAFYGETDGDAAAV